MKLKLVYKIAIAVIIILIILAGVYFYFLDKEDFSINTIMIKLNVLESDETSMDLILTNGNFKQDFILDFSNLEEICFVESNSFSLNPNEKKIIKIKFKGDVNKKGVNVGQLVISGENVVKKIPIIINIEDRNKLFTVLQTPMPEYLSVYPGGKAGVDVKIFNLENKQMDNVKLIYTVKNLDNELIFSEETEIVVEGSIALSKIVDIPYSIPYEDYVFIVSVKYDGMTASSGNLFSISEKSDNFLFGGAKYLIIVIFVFIILIIIAFFYFIKTRDDLLLELKRQQDRELRTNLRAITDYEKNIKCVKNVSTRKRKIKKIKSVKKNIVKEIKAKQKKQRAELKKLMKKGKKEIMRKKMNKWANQGYKMVELKKEKVIPESDIQKQVDLWKQQGYNIDVLKRK